MLADRLRELERAGLVERQASPPPVPATLFRLTSRGEELWPVVRELGRWAGPLLAERRRDDAFRTHWLAVPARLHLADHAPEEPPVTIELRAGEDEPLLIEALEGTIRTRAGPAPDAGLVLAGAPELMAGLLTGRLTLDEARARGLEHEGDPRHLRRVQPKAAPPPSHARRPRRVVSG